MAAKARKSRRAEILRLFTERVAERGYDAVTFREISGELGISKGTIIHHFENKEALLEKLHHDYMSRRLAELHDLYATFDDPATQVRATVFQLMLAQSEDRAATVAFAREIVRFATDDVMSDVRAMRHEYSQLVQGVFRRGVEEGTFIDINPSVGALQLFGMCNWSWTWFEPGGPLPAEEIADDFTRVLLGGLLRAPAPPADDQDEFAAAVRSVMDAHRADTDEIGA